MVTALVACHDDETITAEQKALVASAKEAAKTGEWVVTYYVDSGSDETSDLNGYSFTFGADKLLTATNGNTTVTGRWSVTADDSSSDDDDETDVDFNISFASPALLEELSDDWSIVSVSDTKIELTDVSGGNGGTDFLTLNVL